MSTITDWQVKPGLGVLAEEANQADAKAPKGKNHPSFTIILRKQLPVCFGSGLGQLARKPHSGTSHKVARRSSQNELAQESTRLKETREVAPTADLRLKRDFALAHSWQVWVLDEGPSAVANRSGSDWNVKRHGPPARTARHFWAAYSQLYDHFERISLKNLMIFQDKIEPKWEDKANVGGGRWYFDVSYNSRGESSRRDCLLKANYWTHCLQTVLSSSLGASTDLITGLILNFKPCKYRVSLWTRSCADFNQVIQLGASLRNCLNLRCQLKFELHSPSPSSTVLELN